MEVEIMLKNCQIWCHSTAQWKRPHSTNHTTTDQINPNQALTDSKQEFKWLKRQQTWPKNKHKSISSEWKDNS